MKKELQVVFAVLPNVHLIDLAGPVQVFFEANQFGANFTIRYCGLADHEKVVSQQGLKFSDIPSYEHLTLSENDYLFIAGIEFSSIQKGQLKTGYESFFEWLQSQYNAGVNICSVCSGTFVLAASRMLDHKSCTTHWKCIDYLEKNYPKINVINDQLYVKDGNLYTSAGMTSGIDMALYILEENFGPVLTLKVAREMVVFLRRTGGAIPGQHLYGFQNPYTPCHSFGTGPYYPASHRKKLY